MSSQAAQVNNQLTEQQKQFNQNLVHYIKKTLEEQGPICHNIEQVRVAYELSKKDSTPFPAEWPSKEIYVSMDVIISLYSAFIQEVYKAHNREIQEEELANALVYGPSLLSVLAPWEKTRNIVTITKNDFSNDLLDVPCSIFTSLPSWSIFLNVVDKNYVWNNQNIQGIGFARFYIGSKDPAQPEAVVNNIVSVILLDNGTFDLGPYISIENNKTVKESLETTTNAMLSAFAQDHNVSEADMTAAQETVERTKLLFKPLIYLLQNTDKLKNTKGEAATFNANPELVTIKGNSKIISNDTPANLILE